MTALIINRLQESLNALKAANQYRQIPNLQHHERYVISEGKRLLNIASNDYLGLGSNSNSRAISLINSINFQSIVYLG